MMRSAKLDLYSASSLKQQSMGRHQGRIQDFVLGGTYLKKFRRAEGGAKIFGVFRVKNHDFTPKNHIYFNFRGRAPGAPLLDPPLVGKYAISSEKGQNDKQWSTKNYTEN